MNGRIYDPNLGRFLQADPFIQAPSNSQSYNRYSYVWNNPLSATDPSGYFGIFKKIGRNIIRGAAKIFGAKVVGIAGNIASLFCGPYAPACAAGWNYEYSRAMGVSSSGALRAAFTAAATTYAFQQIGNYYGNASADNLLAAKHGVGSTTFDFGGLSLSGGQIAGQIAAHAAVGGISAELSGGKFGHGFFSAGVTKGLGGAFLPGGSNLKAGDVVKGTVISMVIGGTASVISGGKFANGANTAAMQYLFNQGWQSLTESERGVGVWNPATRKMEYLPPGMQPVKIEGDLLLTTDLEIVSQYVGPDGALDESVWGENAILLSCTAMTLCSNDTELSPPTMNINKPAMQIGSGQVVSPQKYHIIGGGFRIMAPFPSIGLEVGKNVINNMYCSHDPKVVAACGG